MREGRPSSLATTEVPAFIRMRRVVRRARRDLGSLIVVMVVLLIMIQCLPVRLLLYMTIILMIGNNNQMDGKAS